MASIIKANQLQDFGGNSIITSDGAGTITLSSGMNTAVAAGTNNTPAFQATAPNDQSYSDAVMTVIPANTEEYDTDSAYNTSNYRFTPQTAGKYFVYVQAVGDSQGTANLVDSDLYLYKNTTLSGRSNVNCSNNNLRLVTLYTSAVLDMNGSSDYVEARMYLNTGDSSNWLITGNSTWQGTYFGAYKIIT